MDIRRCSKSGGALFRLIRKASLREFFRCLLLNSYSLCGALSAKECFRVMYRAV